jgi:hypothetical protein
MAYGGSRRCSATRDPSFVYGVSYRPHLRHVPVMSGLMAPHGQNQRAIRRSMGFSGRDHRYLATVKRRVLG